MPHTSYCRQTFLTDNFMAGKECFVLPVWGELLLLEDVIDIP